ncbi:DUF6291 domain-containing protein [Eubacteriales bacterium OttesenSCG-928-A19]|nr:DUF6291 domain-containing protein [Eubacteriales bacterium OttesenSCG-928-A19]
MAKKYVKAYYDWVEQMEALSDSEKGRLFVAILKYARGESTENLSGSERIIFPSFKSQIDRDAKVYQTKVDNGRVGGLAKSSESNRTKAKSSESYQDKDKEQDKGIYTTTTTNARAEAFGDEEALAYRLSLDEIKQAAEGIGLPMESRDEQAVEMLYADYCKDWLLEAIKRVADRPKDKRSWGYIKGILKNWRENGGIDSPDRPPRTATPAPAKQVLAQQYTQREYSRDELNQLFEEV